MRSRQIRQKFLPSKVRLPTLVWLVTPFYYQSYNSKVLCVDIAQFCSTISMAIIQHYFLFTLFNPPAPC
jgi:hypothetical protein